MTWRSAELRLLPPSQKFVYRFERTEKSGELIVEFPWKTAPLVEIGMAKLPADCYDSRPHGTIFVPPLSPCHKPCLVNPQCETHRKY